MRTSSLRGRSRAIGQTVAVAVRQTDADVTLRSPSGAFITYDITFVGGSIDNLIATDPSETRAGNSVGGQVGGSDQDRIVGTADRVRIDNFSDDGTLEAIVNGSARTIPTDTTRTFDLGDGESDGGGGGGGGGGTNGGGDDRELTPIDSGDDGDTNGETNGGGDDTILRPPDSGDDQEPAGTVQAVGCRNVSITPTGPTTFDIDVTVDVERSVGDVGNSVRNALYIDGGLAADQLGAVPPEGTNGFIISYRGISVQPGTHTVGFAVVPGADSIPNVPQRSCGAVSFVDESGGADTGDGGLDQPPGGDDDRELTPIDGGNGDGGGANGNGGNGGNGGVGGGDGGDGLTLQEIGLILLALGGGAAAASGRL